MEAARLPAIRSIRLDRRQLGLVALLLVLAALAWLVTDDRMAGMDAGPGTDPGSLGFYVSAWVVMMAAMMFPSVAPMVLAYHRIQKRRRELGKSSARPGGTAVFVGGYLASWTAFGLIAYGLFVAIRSIDIDALAWEEGGPYLAGGVIVAAALYQLTPVKDACLSKCRGPLSFVLGYWREGYGGALRMGVQHGGWCVGCCWALMAALFALGVMSVAWMAFVAALIAAEKTLPWGRATTWAVAALLLGLGVALVAAPDAIPGLTVPDGAMDGGSRAGAMGMP